MGTRLKSICAIVGVLTVVLGFALILASIAAAGWLLTVVGTVLGVFSLHTGDRMYLS